MALVADELGRIPWRARDTLACLIDGDGVGFDLGDRIDGHQELRLAKSQKAAGANLHEPDLLLAVIHQEVLDGAHLLAGPIDHLAATDIL